MMPAAPPFERFAEMFAAHGGTDLDYLRFHFPRYVRTKQRLLTHWNRADGNRILDIGAHWLHQALLYAIDGFAVTALDLPLTLEDPRVRSLAPAHAIAVLPNADLEYPSAMRTLAESSFDLVLLTEVIEHLAFNPVALWREVYRVLRPGGRIVLTTPNYYALRSRARRWLRGSRARGGGVDVRDVLTLKTLGHHWKEYSMRELHDYFRLLSPDFRCIHAAYTEDYQPAYRSKRGGALVHGIERALPPLRPDIYLEIALMRKDHGIVIQPHW